MHYLLLYDYVENAVERRAPFREEHLRLARDRWRIRPWTVVVGA